ncbi:MAG: CRISPR-associated protein Cas4 [Firmicutes bacterium]|jgi:CRISPR-associated exonuclease Cas4|nr:CRISPR-associated protein Cas4 [Bacillota bacterium]
MTDNNERREWTDEELVPLASLNQYCYCPLRCYYIYVAEEFEDNVHTLQGTIIHERVHQVSQHKVGEKLEVRGIYLFSRRYGIIGKADLIEIDQEVFIPVEYKKGRRGDWLNDQVQLCAQAMALEDATGKDVKYGYLYYASSGRRYRVEFTSELKAHTVEAIESVRKLLVERKRPKAFEGVRCQGCSLRESICLPAETRQIISLGEDTLQDN